MDEGKLSLESKDTAEEKRQELLRLFPEAQTEGGKIDFDQLKRALGESVDAGRERYGMNWPGKADCFRLIQSPSTATLLPVRGESVRFDDTENMIIEGDNLEVLKLLQKGYQNKVKMIYIDPPYNTGNDFIYPDDYTDNLKNYLQYTRQADADGKKFSNNPESDGRFHSKWLNMMYPRLYLARNLLRSDGVIFISIDEREVANLRLLADEIFGSNNALGEFIWQAKKGGGSDNHGVVAEHEYVICYARNIDSEPLGAIYIEAAPLDKNDSKGPYRRGRELNKWGANSLREDRPTMFFPILGPGGQEVLPIRNDGKEGCWRWGKKKMLAAAQQQEIDFVMRDNGTFIAYEKVRSTEARGKPHRTMMSGTGQTADGSKAVKELFADEKVFDFAKPQGLMGELLTMGAPADEDDYKAANDLVLDFFAGSGSLAHAALASNNHHLSFILVQLPEPTNRDDYKTIADITKERVRRVIQQHEKEAEGRLDLQQEGNPSRKEGFRVFKLAPSNFKVWDAHTDEGVEGVERQMELAVNHIMPDRTAEDLFYEILMKSEYPLTAKVKIFDAAGVSAYSVNDDELIVCVERKVTEEATKAIAKLSPSKVIFLDEAFSGNDQLKANAKMNFESAGVKRFETV